MKVVVSQALKATGPHGSRFTRLTGEKAYDSPVQILNKSIHLDYGHESMTDMPYRRTSKANLEIIGNLLPVLRIQR
jgi:hypothetical protein